MLTRSFATLVERLLDDPQAALGRVQPKVLAKLRAAVRRNCLPEHLSPGRRDELARERGETDILRLPETEFAQRLAAGEDPFDLMARYPDDVDTHDRALGVAAERDADFGKRVKRYLRERKCDAYNHWPYNGESLDPRLALPIDAAFRAGLKVAPDHPKAHAGLTRAVLSFDDDRALAAADAAITLLDPGDDRVKYVIAGLARSRHPRRNEVLRKGAWRFMEQVEDLREQISERDARVPTLNDVFHVDSHLRTAVSLVLREVDEEAEKLAEAILAHRTGLRVFGAALASAYKVMGTRRNVRFAEQAGQICLAIADLPQEPESFLSDETLIVLCEASLAFARLAPEAAIPVLDALFARENPGHFFDLDLKAGLLPGLLVLRPQDPVLLALLERILANRCQDVRIYGALRAVEEARPPQAAPWIRRHVFDEPSALSDGPSLLSVVAQRAEVALGLPASPAMDTDDVYAIRVAPGDLVAALDRPDRYRVAHVLEKIKDEKVQGPHVVEKVSEILTEWLRFSRDHHQDHSRDVERNALKILFAHGPDGIATMARALDLPFMGPGHKTWVLRFMRFGQTEAQVRQYLEGASIEDLLRTLENPPPLLRAWVDVLSAVAAARDPARTRPTLERALLARLDLCRPGWSGYHDEDEATLARLPLVYASAYCAEAKALLERLLVEWDGCYRVEESLGTALVQCDERLPAPPPLQDKATLDLAIPSNRTLTHSYQLILAGDSVSWRSLTTDCGFEGIVGGQDLASSGELRLAGPAEARAHTEGLLQELLLLGYRVVVPPKRKKR